MASASETRRSFKDKARDKLVSIGFGTKSKSNDNNQNNQNKNANDEEQGGYLNPLAWDNLSTVVKDSLDAAADSFNVPPPPPVAQPQDSDSETKDQKKKLKKHPPLVPKGSLDYQVQDRDTLNSIAAKFDTTPSELKKRNKLMSNYVFAGQTIYVPDKNYVPSTPSTPSPLEEDKSLLEKEEGKPEDSPAAVSSNSQPPSPDIPLVGRIERKGPGIAERQDSLKKKPRPLSMSEAKNLDQECYERFIKVNVKHITDGQGVVKGVLLVTPNAIMFDPDVSDTLVIEHGAEKYGMIAPMETIISAAMYHDIAAMRLKNVSPDPTSPRPVPYHAKDCPLYDSRHTADQPHKPAGEYKDSSSTNHDNDNDIDLDVFKDKKDSVDAAPTRRFRLDSSCSCGAGAEGNAPQDQFSFDDLTSENASDASQQKASGGKSDSPGVGMASDSLASVHESSSSGGGGMTPEASAVKTNQASAIPDVIQSVMGQAKEELNEQSLSLASGDNNTASQAAVDVIPKTETTPGEGDNQEGSHIKEKTAMEVKDEAEGFTTGKDGEEKTDEKGEEKQGEKEQDKQKDDEATDEGDTLGDLQSEASAPVTVPGNEDNTAGTSPSQAGILSRTIGSFSSIGSSFSSHSPNFSSIVDFSSGLFARTSDERGKVKDLADVSMNSPPKYEAVMTPGGPEHAHKPDVSVHNVVRLDDKPELFQDLNELIPKPASHYEDPPLYLCLKVGLPINKRVSRTCPIESYSKKKVKPEYWFSIPRERVDHLYAFFVQWSPNIYGGEEEIDPKEKGFIVIDDEEDEDFESMDVVEDHFDAQGSTKKKVTRQMTKDWEIVNVDEVRRRLSLAEEEAMPLPDLSDTSTLMQEDHVKKIAKSLPARAVGYSWTLIYSSDKHGFSLKSLYRFSLDFDSPTLLVVKDTANNLFGALISCSLKKSDHFYGTGESFLYTFYPEFRKFSWSGGNNFFIKGNDESLAIGAGEGSFGLWLDGDLYHGRTQVCQTYDNDLLTESEDFVVKGLEAWGFV